MAMKYTSIKELTHIGGFKPSRSAFLQVGTKVTVVSDDEYPNPFNGVIAGYGHKMLDYAGYPAMQFLYIVQCDAPLNGRDPVTLVDPSVVFDRIAWRNVKCPYSDPKGAGTCDQFCRMCRGKCEIVSFDAPNICGGCNGGGMSAYADRYCTACGGTGVIE